MPKETEKGEKVTRTNIRGKAKCAREGITQLLHMLLLIPVKQKLPKAEMLANFVSPILFSFTTLLGTKGQLDQQREQREHIVSWSGRDKIACRNKDGMQDNNDVLTDCYGDLSTFH